jgi:hypothetical protein
MTVIYVPDPITAIRERPGMYISNSAHWSLEQKLLMRVVEDTVFLNAIDLLVERHGGWILVGSSTDWLRLGKFPVSAPLDLFNGPMPFYEAGQNSVRSEAVIRALSEKVFVLGPEGHEFLVPYGKGDHEQPVLDAAQGMRKLRVVGFRVNDEKRSSESLALGQSGFIAPNAC